jgi:hypothetical protein
MSYGGGSYGGGGGGYGGGPGGYGGGYPQTSMGGGGFPSANDAAEYAGNVGNQMANFSRQDGLGAKFNKGPQGIQMLAFVGGCAAVFIGVFGIFRIAEEGFVEWIICFYQIVFGLIMVTLEIQGEWVDKYPYAKEKQAQLVEYCRFLTILGGRGAFYFFVGSLTIGNAVSTPFEWDEFAVGAYIFFIGGVCIAMQFNPQVGAQAQPAGGYGGGGYGEPPPRY